MFKHYINGKTVMGRGTLVDIINPATEETAGSLAWADGCQAQEALEAAQRAFSRWSHLSINERGLWINKLADAIEAERDAILDLLMAETGKPLANAVYDFNMLVDCLKYFWEEAKRLNGTIIQDYDNTHRNLIIRQPLGVVVGYLAWNFPLLNVGYKLGPILASGCTCVLKPSSKTPLATLYIGQLAEKIGFPAGVINIIAGTGSEIGKVLSQSSIPKMITLIGSSDAGRTIIGQSSTSIKRYSLELGGNAPAIVMPDADIEKAAELLVGLKFDNTGQVCVSPNRVYVHKSVHDAFVNAARRYAQRIRLGWGREPEAQMGPMISKEDRARMFALVENAISMGAELICGGNIPEGMDKGYWFSPTILARVTGGMRVYKEEIFGPVMPILTFQMREEVIKEANNTEYGLASYLFSNNVKDIFDIAEALEFGTVCVNEPFYAFNLPHGGIKESGVGKDCSVYSLEEYYYIKRISIKV